MSPQEQCTGLSEAVLSEIESNLAAFPCPRANEGRAAAEGVPFSNTPPLTKSGFTGGEDWFEWCLYVDWVKVWEKLQPELQRAKEIAADRNLSRQTGLDLVSLGEHKAQVNPSGVSLGKKGKGMHMAYRLNCEGLVIQIANRSTCNGNAPNVVIRADGTQCLEHGARGCLDLGMAIIQGAGGTIHQKKLSRVDMCLDLPGVGMEDFIAAYKEQRYICRANNRGYMESNGVTLYLGKHPLQLRIYDKVAQLVMANDPLKFMLMQERRWHAIQQNEATRVEFEIGREALKDRGIDTPEDYFKKRAGADLISYLCHEWVRFTAQAVDRTNTSRAEVLPLWLKVEKGFQDWLGLPVGESLEALDRGSVDVRMLARQAIGVMMTAAVIQGLTFKHEERLIGYVDRSFRRELASMDISGEMARRQTQLGS